MFLHLYVDMCTRTYVYLQRVHTHTQALLSAKKAIQELEK